ncbi:MAG: SIS domain-containing protein [Proteobacteria bacterium]|jgi:D-sedoheptulose 7-phosphate isomerase|nr:SIS domain-containing protein [Pseudomonadota bacterium]MBT5226581.1 SIS domain-containing protein [Pseudomonadota bacterium]MBT5817026.1 SIS domain-containing protein [Pseudomonadota bacterium]|tara:strand:- start:683 stop:1270 length:588 start_codon:yes stop_codon:yes gene_type:complete
MSQRIVDHFNQSAQTALASGESLADDILRASEAMLDTLDNGGKLLLCGNGGSATDAMHFSAELLVRFQKERKALPAVALVSDTATLTATGNDYAFDQIFSRQIEALAASGDHLVVITTSGNSPNILNAVSASQKKEGVRVTALTGRDGGALASMLNQGDYELRVPSDSTARIQEAHAIIIHCFCDLIDQHYCGEH